MRNKQDLRQRSGPKSMPRKEDPPTVETPMPSIDAANTAEAERRKREQDVAAMKLMAMMVLVMLLTLYYHSGLHTYLFPPYEGEYVVPPYMKRGLNWKSETSHSNYKRNECVEICLAGDLECPEKCGLIAHDRARRWLANTCLNHDGVGSSVCWLYETCERNSKRLGVCSSMALLDVICTAKDAESAVAAREDKLCADYQALCVANGKKIKGCSRSEPLRELPPRSEAEAAIEDMCNAMPMPGCHCHDDSCPPAIERLADLCAHMHMPQCKPIDETCKALDKHKDRENSVAVMTKLQCRELKKFQPEMTMYFHWGVHEYVLFKDYVPSGIIEYFAACASIISAGILSTLLKGLRHRRQQLWDASPLAIHETDPAASLGLSGALSAIFQVAFDNSVEVRPQGHAGRLLVRNMTRAFLTCVITTIDYGLMLLAMTFNGGFFICIILSFGIGQMLYGHWFHRDVFVRPSRNAEAPSSPHLD